MSSRASDTAIDEKSVIEEEITTTVVADETTKHVEWKEPPDGGWKAWLVVFGSFCAIGGSSGFLASWSVFLNYYNTNVYPNNMTLLSWIGSLSSCIRQLIGPLYAWSSSKMDDRYTIAIGGLVTCLSLMLASITHEIWQLWITQGIMLGIGTALVWYPCINQTMTWFSKRRALAVGIALSGMGLPPMAFTNIATACFQTVGYRWALRVLGFIGLVMCGIGAILCMKLNPRPKSSVVPLLDLSVFKNKNFIILIIAHFLIAFVITVPAAFIAPYAESFGVDPYTIANITGIMGVFSFIGSIIFGQVADYIGRFNMAVLIGLLCVILELGVWFTAATAASLWVFSVLYGMANATFFNLVVALIVDCVGTERSEVGTGWALFTWSVGALVGQPLASMIANQTSVPNYQMAIVFTSVIFFFVTCLLLVLRIMIGGWKVVKKV